jgi:hypothetical protein
MDANGALFAELWVTRLTLGDFRLFPFLPPSISEMQ